LIDWLDSGLLIVIMLFTFWLLIVCVNCCCLRWLLLFDTDCCCCWFIFTLFWCVGDWEITRLLDDCWYNVVASLVNFMRIVFEWPCIVMKLWLLWLLYSWPRCCWLIVEPHSYWYFVITFVIVLLIPDNDYLHCYFLIDYILHLLLLLYDHISFIVVVIIVSYCCSDYYWWYIDGIWQLWLFGWDYWLVTLLLTIILLHTRFVVIVGDCWCYWCCATHYCYRCLLLLIVLVCWWYCCCCSWLWP